MSSINVGITADVTDATTKLAIVSAAFKQSSTEVRQLATGFVKASDDIKGSLSPALEAAVQNNAKLASTMAAMRAEMSSGTTAFQGHAAAANSNRMAYMELGHSVKAVTDMLIAGTSPARAFTMESARLVQASTMLKGVNWSAIGATAGIVALGVAMAALTMRMSGVEREYERMSAVMKLSGNDGSQIRPLVAAMEQLQGVTRQTAESMIGDFSTLGPITTKQFTSMASVSQMYSQLMKGDVLEASKRITAMMNGDVSGAFSEAERMGINFTAAETAQAEETERLHGKHAALGQVLDEMQKKLKDAHGVTEPFTKNVQDLAKAWEHLLDSMADNKVMKDTVWFLSELTERAALLVHLSPIQDLDNQIGNLTKTMLEYQQHPYLNFGVFGGEQAKAEIATIEKKIEELQAKRRQLSAGDQAPKATFGSDADEGPSDKSQKDFNEAHKDVLATATKIDVLTQQIKDANEQIAAAQMRINAGQETSNAGLEKTKQIKAALQQQLEAEIYNEARLNNRKEPGDATEMAKWQETLDQKKAAQGVYRQNDLQADVAYWQEILSHAGLNESQEVAIKQKIAEAQVKINDQTATATFTAMEREVDAATAGSAQKMALIQKLKDFAATKFNEQSTEYKKAMDKEVTATKEASAQKIEIAKNDADTISMLASMNDGAEIEHDKALAAQGIITANQLADAEIAASNRAYDAKMAALNAELQAENLTAAQINAIGNQEVIAFQKQQRDMQKAADQRATEEAQQSKATADAIASSFSGVVMGYLKGQNTIKQGGIMLAQQLVQSQIEGGIKQVALWGVQESKKLAASVATYLGITTASEASDTSGMVATVAANNLIIQSDAAVAAAGAYAATACIPFVGPGLAPEAAATAGAAVTAMHIASAEGGWGAVPNDQIAQLHKNEMVLPAPIAEGVRNMTANGGANGGGGDVHLHVHAMDAQSVKRLFANNGAALMATLKQQKRNFAI